MRTRGVCADWRTISLSIRKPSSALVLRSLLVPFLCVLATQADAQSTWTAGWATRGMVVSDCGLASEAGVSILESGGNAADAAAATAFALAVTFPAAGNIGGGGFALVHKADGGDAALDFREVAPNAAHRDLYLDEQGKVVNGLSTDTHLAAGIPGSVDGLLRLHEDHGSGLVDRAQVLAPAIRLARDGFPLSFWAAYVLNAYRGKLETDEAARRIFLRGDGQLWQPGDVLKQPDLADALERISQQGRDGFYKGVTAELWVEEMERGNGIATLEDLAGYDSKYRDPVRGEFRGYEILSMSPPSSGGILVLQLLEIMDGFPLEEWEWNSSSYVHAFAEACRRVYADRAEHLGDPDHWEVPVPGLLDPEYLEARMADMSLERATPSTAVSSGTPTPREPDETTHFSVVDKEGNVVSCTTTLNARFGSGIVVDGTGILLNNEMDDFSAKPGVPNLYGLVGNEANAIAAGKRMLSSMSPTIVLHDGHPRLVLGSPGGSRIITSVAQVILNHLVFEMPIAQAVAVPRVHAQWLPDRVYYEPFGMALDTRKRLEELGHELAEMEEIGRVNAIEVQPNGFYAGPDVRGGGASAGY